MACFGSDRIRGHGIPEAIEAILMNGSRVQPRVGLLAISSAISIGTGGPFGAEGPIIDDGRFRWAPLSLSFFSPHRRRAKDAARAAGAAGRNVG